MSSFLAEFSQNEVKFPRRFDNFVSRSKSPAMSASFFAHPTFEFSFRGDRVGDPFECFMIHELDRQARTREPVVVP
jgi:hypothetical protein